MITYEYLNEKGQEKIYEFEYFKVVEVYET